jgi:hypothetical protein
MNHIFNVQFGQHVGIISCAKQEISIKQFGVWFFNQACGLNEAENAGWYNNR